MRTLALISLLAVPTIATAAPKAPSKVATTVESLSARFLEGLFRAKPHLATFMGEHTYDGKLPDHSPAALKAREKELALLQKLVADVATPSLDAEIDKQILADGISL